MSEIEISSDDDGWVFDSLVNFLHGPIWKLPVLGFVEEKSVVFDPDSYKNMNDEKEDEYRKIHEEYKTLVDYMLTNFMEDISVSPEQVEEACQQRGDSISRTQQESLVTRVALEQLWAAEDFNTFRRLMTRKNIDLQLQSLELLVAKYGVLSPSLRSTEAMSAEGDNGEEDFLQVVIRYSDQSDLLHNETFVPSPTPSTKKNSSSSGAEKKENLAEYESVLIHSDFTTASTSCSAPFRIKNKEQILVETDTTKDKFQVAQSASAQFKSQILEQERHAAAIDQSENEQDDESSVPQFENKAKRSSHKRDEVTVAEIASVAPEQHRMLTSVRKALEVKDDELSPESPNIELPTVGTEEEIARRREYLRSQRDKLVALKKKEREKQLSNADKVAEAGHTLRPKSARAAKLAMSSVAIPDSGTNDKSHAARRALADRLKQELITHK